MLSTVPAAADQLRMDHQNVTVEPIEVAEDSPESPQPDSAKEVSHEAFEPTVHEAVDTGPEVDPQPAAGPADKPFFPAQAGQEAAEVAVETDPEPAGMDPLMEAAEAHDQAGGDAAIESEAAASESAKEPVQTAAPAASKPVKEPVKVAAVAPEKKTDIFDKWAHSKFKAHKEKAPHPLAAQHPDEFVVVCEAGCAYNPVEIVYMERRDARGPVNEKPLKAGIVAGTSSIDCVGGCYNGRNSYGAIAATWDPSVTVVESEWMTTVKKAGDKPAAKKDADSSSRWYQRIN